MGLIYVGIKKIGENITLSTSSFDNDDFSIIMVADATSDKYIKKINGSDLESFKQILEKAATEKNDNFFIIFGVKVFKNCKTISATKLLLLIGYYTDFLKNQN